jgi:hypothetical protein
MTTIPSPMDDLEARLEELLDLLAEHREPYWHRRLSAALDGVRANRLGGVSQVLGVYGGEDTFSDLVLAPADPARATVANRELVRLRDRVFELADGISNATARG